MDLRAYYKKLREAEAALTGRTHCDGEPGDIRRRKSRRADGSAACDCGKADRGSRGRGVATEEEASEFHEAHRAGREAHEEDGGREARAGDGDSFA